MQRYGGGRSGRPAAEGSALALAQGLGWFSIGLGLAEVLAPRSLARSLGMEEHAGLIRVYGMREIATGVGILSGGDPTPWIWGRVGGDALDLATLAPGLSGDNPQKGNVGLALAAVAGVTALDVLCARQLSEDGQDHAGTDDRAGRRQELGGEPAPDEPEVQRSITIEKPADELHRLWREPETLPKVMGHFAEVAPTGEDRARWTVRGPLGPTFEWETEIVEERVGEVVRWTSLPGADPPNAGTLSFRPATSDRGTVVTLRLRFDPPGGMLGDAVVRLLGGPPAGIVSKSLRYFKSLAETGEIPTTDRQPAARADTR